MEHKIAEIKFFFDIQVDCYILGDLERLMNIQFNYGDCGGCSIPIGMVIISAMEMFGTLLTENPSESRGTEYLKNFMEFYVPEISSEDRNSIVYNYRHKMMHVFFPKIDYPKMYGVTRLPVNGELIHKPDGYIRLLNIPEFCRLFRGGVERLRKKIFEERDELIINTIYNNLHIEQSETNSSTTGQQSTSRIG
ncbi:MAG: hypothetical protein C5B59_00925 [Bacteroidetes bacterium]|nr:MAG: hypothetical protein C5B59_00925 [Bacteroidota bacterium]